MVFSVIYAVSVIAATPLSWLFFRRVVSSHVGEVLGLQKLKNRNYSKNANKIINIAIGIALAFTIGAINAFTLDETAYQVFIKGVCVGLALGFYAAIRPERIKE